jgi:large conductance mechanosensitive channel
VKQIYDEFKAFILRGNVVDLAIAVVIGTAFAAVVVSFTNDIIMPIVAAIFGKPNFNDIGFNLGDSRVAVGSFITAVVTFVIIAAAVFFFVVKPINWLMARRKQEEAEGVVEPPEDVVLLREIRDLLAQQRRQ